MSNTKSSFNPQCFWLMTTVYFHYIIDSQFCIIPNNSQTVLNDSTYLSLYFVSNFLMEYDIVEYIIDLNRRHKEKSHGSGIESVLAKQVAHPFESRCLDTFCLNKLWLGWNSSEEHSPSEKCSVVAANRSVGTHYNVEYLGCSTQFILICKNVRSYDMFY